jgi:hypothetical protein
MTCSSSERSSILFRDRVTQYAMCLNRSQREREEKRERLCAWVCTHVERACALYGKRKKKKKAESLIRTV